MKFMKNKTTNKSKIPEFKSFEEEAEFWDTHDTTDLLDEFRPVNVIYQPGNKVESLTIKLTTSMKSALASYARDRHLGVSSLARAWIIEKLGEVKGISRKRSVKSMN